MQDHTVETRQGAHLRAPSIDRGPRLSNVARERIAGYLFVAPDAIGLMIFVGGPMILSLSLGFFSVSGFGEYTFVGLDNYRRMLGDPLFCAASRSTILYVVALVPPLCCRARARLACASGHALQRRHPHAALHAANGESGRRRPRLAGAGRRQDRALHQLGRHDRHRVDFMARRSPLCLLGTVIAISVWFLMGFYMLIFLGGLQDIPKEYYEAAASTEQAPSSPSSKSRCRFCARQASSCCSFPR